MFYRVVLVYPEQVGNLSGCKLEVLARQLVELLDRHDLAVGGIQRPQHGPV